MSNFWKYSDSCGRYSVSRKTFPCPLLSSTACTIHTLKYGGLILEFPLSEHWMDKEFGEGRRWRRAWRVNIRVNSFCDSKPESRRETAEEIVGKKQRTCLLLVAQKVKVNNPHRFCLKGFVMKSLSCYKRFASRHWYCPAILFLI